MFQQNTVFILGAGASWHYGYPTGYDLIEKVLNKANNILKFETFKEHGHYYAPSYNTNIPQCYKQENEGKVNPKETWENLQNECKELVLKLKTTAPLSIDVFLKHNASVEKITKLLIGWILLECEYKYENAECNPNRLPSNQKPIPNKRNDNWVKFIVSKLLNAKNICDNKVDFITFNYDFSLENRIKEALDNTENVDSKSIDTFFENRIHHVYGKLIKQDDFNDSYSKFLKNKTNHFGEIIDISYKSSKNLEIISPKSNEELSNIQSKISNARSIYILGYGFDQMNNNNLKLDENLNKDVCNDTSTKVYFTNMNDRNITNKIISKLFFRDITKFMPGESFIQKNGERGFYYEKSIKNVYEALSEDFDL